MQSREYKTNWMRNWRKEHPQEAKIQSKKLYQVRKSIPEYYKKIAKSVRNWRIRNPEKAKAHNIVYSELRAGRIKKQPCEFCGNLKVHAHHKDYSKPLEINWLCVEHHGIITSHPKLIIN